MGNIWNKEQDSWKPSRTSKHSSVNGNDEEEIVIDDDTHEDKKTSVKVVPQKKEKAGSGSNGNKEQDSEKPSRTSKHSSVNGNDEEEIAIDDDTHEDKKTYVKVAPNKKEKAGSEYESKILPEEVKQQFETMVKILLDHGVETVLLTSQKRKDLECFGSPLGQQFLKDNPTVRHNFTAYCTGERSIETTDLGINVAFPDPVPSIYYFQKDDGNENFETFCRKFLSKYSVKRQKTLKTTSKPLFLVLNLPVHNRQNILDVLSHLITEATKGYDLSENQDMCVVQISFDGNCSWNPPSLMTDTIFEALQSNVKIFFASYINIIYTDDYNFTKCCYNEKAKKDIKSYLAFK